MLPTGPQPVVRAQYVIVMPIVSVSFYQVCTKKATRNLALLSKKSYELVLLSGLNV